MAKKPPRTTEQRNPRTRGLDGKSTPDILQAIHREDATVAHAVARAIPEIAKAVDAIAQALHRGGRLFYVGAGTSGRLAALDAAEIPPTFGTPARLVQAVIAGGRRALTHAVEGAEDNRARGARDLAACRLNRNDVVVGITASGSTPYVLGALEFARRRCAITHRRHVESADINRGDGENQHRHPNGAGSHHRVDANEGGHGPKNGPQHAFHCCDDSLGTRP